MARRNTVILNLSMDKGASTNRGEEDELVIRVLQNRKSDRLKRIGCRCWQQKGKSKGDTEWQLMQGRRGKV